MSTESTTSSSEGNSSCGPDSVSKKDNSSYTAEVRSQQHCEVDELRSSSSADEKQKENSSESCDSVLDMLHKLTGFPKSFLVKAPFLPSHDSDFTSTLMGVAEFYESPVLMSSTMFDVPIQQQSNISSISSEDSPFPALLPGERPRTIRDHIDESFKSNKEFIANHCRAAQALITQVMEECYVKTYKEALTLLRTYDWNFKLVKSKVKFNSSIALADHPQLRDVFFSFLDTRELFISVRESSVKNCLAVDSFILDQAVEHLSYMMIHYDPKLGPSVAELEEKHLIQEAQLKRQQFDMERKKLVSQVEKSISSLKRPQELQMRSAAKYSPVLRPVSIIDETAEKSLSQSESRNLQLKKVVNDEDDSKKHSEKTKYTIHIGQNSAPVVEDYLEIQHMEKGKRYVYVNKKETSEKFKNCLCTLCLNRCQGRWDCPGVFSLDEPHPVGKDVICWSCASFLALHQGAVSLSLSNRPTVPSLTTTTSSSPPSLPTLKQPPVQQQPPSPPGRSFPLLDSIPPLAMAPPPLAIAPSTSRHAHATLPTTTLPGGTFSFEEFDRVLPEDLPLDEIAELEWDTSERKKPPLPPQQPLPPLFQIDRKVLRNKAPVVSFERGHLALRLLTRLTQHHNVFIHEITERLGFAPDTFLPKLVYEDGTYCPCEEFSTGTPSNDDANVDEGYENTTRHHHRLIVPDSDWTCSSHWLPSEEQRNVVLLRLPATDGTRYGKHVDCKACSFSFLNLIIEQPFNIVNQQPVPMNDPFAALHNTNRPFHSKPMCGVVTEIVYANSFRFDNSTTPASSSAGSSSSSGYPPSPLDAVMDIPDLLKRSFQADPDSSSRVKLLRLIQLPTAENVLLHHLVTGGGSKGGGVRYDFLAPDCIVDCSLMRGGIDKIKPLSAEEVKKNTEQPRVPGLEGGEEDGVSNTGGRGDDQELETAPSLDFWPCSQCTFHNTLESTQCSICECERTAATSPPARPSTSLFESLLFGNNTDPNAQLAQQIDQRRLSALIGRDNTASSEGESFLKSSRRRGLDIFDYAGVARPVEPSSPYTASVDKDGKHVLLLHPTASFAIVHPFTLPHGVCLSTIGLASGVPAQLVPVLRPSISAVGKCHSSGGGVEEEEVECVSTTPSSSSCQQVQLPEEEDRELKLFPSDSNFHMDTTPLKMLTEVPSNAWYRNPFLGPKLNLSPLIRLRGLDRCSLNECSKLVHVDLGSPSLLHIGDGVLNECSSLRTIDLSGAVNLRTIGISFAVRCPQLSTFKFPLEGAASKIKNQQTKNNRGGDKAEESPLHLIGTNFLLDSCFNLRKLDFSSVPNLSVVGFWCVMTGTFNPSGSSGYVPPVLGVSSSSASSRPPPPPPLPRSFVDRTAGGLGPGLDVFLTPACKTSSTSALRPRRGRFEVLDLTPLKNIERFSNDALDLEDRLAAAGVKLKLTAEQRDNYIFSSFLDQKKKTSSDEGARGGEGGTATLDDIFQCSQELANTDSKRKKLKEGDDMLAEALFQRIMSKKK